MADNGTWNVYLAGEIHAAFDAGFAAALGKPIVTLHDPELTHALKEVDRAAMATAETPELVVEMLRYATVKE